MNHYKNYECLLFLFLKFVFKNIKNITLIFFKNYFCYLDSLFFIFLRKKKTVFKCHRLRYGINLKLTQVPTN